MRVVNLLQPGRIVFGDGCALQCAEDSAARGSRRVFVVTSSVLVGLADPLVAAFRQRGALVEVYARIDAEPSIAIFEDALAAARAARVDAVIGIGGGSAMDVAKLVAALYASGQRLRDVFGLHLLGGRSLYLACIPTTSGTGSEVSPNAILYDESDSLKKGVISAFLVPDAAYVDPQLTLSVPPAVTAATGIDALAHCIEAYANRFSHPAVDTYALQGIRLIGSSLLRACRNGGDAEARANLSLGSLYGGLCLGPVNTAAVHALAYPLGGEFHVPHGISIGVLLTHVLRRNLECATERYADIALALGAVPGGSAEATARKGLDRLEGLCDECGIPRRMSVLGVAREVLPRMAKAAMTVTRLLKNNPRELTEDETLAIYEAAY